MVRVKICGITNDDDALKAVYYGASALGFIFHKKSPRYVSPSKAKKIIEALPPFVSLVGVFVNLNERAVRDICRFTGISTIQCHGDEEPGYFKRFREYKTIKAFRIKNRVDTEEVQKYNVDAYLFDTHKDDQYGGTGEAFDWNLIKTAEFKKPIILSGGLNPFNVKQAIAAVQPFAVDVSSGVEKTPGQKDPRQLKTLFDVINFST